MNIRWAFTKWGDGIRAKISGFGRKWYLIFEQPFKKCDKPYCTVPIMSCHPTLHKWEYFIQELGDRFPQASLRTIKKISARNNSRETNHPCSEKDLFLP